MRSPNSLLSSYAVLSAACSCLPARAQTITALSAATLPQAGRLVIRGSGFGAQQGVGTVTIGGFLAPVAQWSGSKITAYVPDTAPFGSDEVAVDANGGSSNTLPLTVTARQSSGRVLWRFQADGLYIQGRPAVGPDGTVYALDVAGHLYALTPSGGLKWIYNGADEAFESVAVGADGTVYFAAGSSLYAITSEGQQKWNITDPSGGNVAAGANVGHDGNICAVFSLGASSSAMGALTISPSGAILNSVPGFFVES
jgi:outer membrane protein assembly factor BamB